MAGVSVTTPARSNTGSGGERRPITVDRVADGARPIAVDRVSDGTWPIAVEIRPSPTLVAPQVRERVGAGGHAEEQGNFGGPQHRVGVPRHVPGQPGHQDRRVRRLRQLDDVLGERDGSLAGDQGQQDGDGAGVRIRHQSAKRLAQHAEAVHGGAGHVHRIRRCGELGQRRGQALPGARLQLGDRQPQPGAGVDQHDAGATGRGQNPDASRAPGAAVAEYRARLDERGQVARFQDPGLGHEAANQHRRAPQRAAVRQDGASRFARHARTQQDDLLADGERPCPQSEQAAAVMHALGIDRELADAVLGKQRLGDLEPGDVGLVAGGDPPAEAQLGLAQHGQHRGCEGTALGHDGQRPRGRQRCLERRREAQRERPFDVQQTEAVGTEQPNARLGRDCDQFLLQTAPLVTRLGESRAQHDRRSDARFAAGRDRRDHPMGGQAHHRHVDRRRQVPHVRVAGDVTDPFMAGGDQEDRPGEAGCEGVPAHLAADLAGVGRGPDDRNALRVEQTLDAGAGPCSGFAR